MFPKLLIATEFPPNASGGGPAVVRQMLKQWPADRLLWWSCLPEQDERFGQKVSVHQVATIPARLRPNRRWTRQKSWLLDTFWAGWAARNLRRMLHERRPDVVWAIPHLWSIPPLHGALPDSGFRFHISIHDFPDAQSSVIRFGELRARRLAQYADQLYANANTRDAICTPMESYLRELTGKEGLIAHAGVESEDFTFLEGYPAKEGGSIRIAYAGTIIVEPEFRLFVQCLNKVRTKIGKPLTLEFFGSHSYASRDWFDAAWMKEHGNLPEPQLSTALRDCTWGFSPMALTDEDPRYNRFSFPTKFISYLAAGLPIISLGHPESSVAKVAGRFETGICITSGTETVIVDQLLTAFALESPRNHFRSALLRCAREEFSAEGMRSRLYECLGQRQA